MKRANKANADRYGIGEWYGRLFVGLTPAERKDLARTAKAHKGGKHGGPLPCIARGGRVLCSKKGGVCSLRLYHQDPGSGLVAPAEGTRGHLVTVCPYRFVEQNTIFAWIGRELLNDPTPVIVREVGFLEREPSAIEAQSKVPAREDVGRIDNILVSAGPQKMSWCALEIQAVYFSGPNMASEFEAVARRGEDALPFPASNRRPDYRSSGPKRLMPQLQIKVPSLRRWGKKMAVVVDQGFFGSLGAMDSVSHVSNCDIVWFVVRYEETGGRAHIAEGCMRMTTLERAVEGLTAGHAVSLELFEERICGKLSQAATDPSSVDLG